MTDKNGKARGEYAAPALERALDIFELLAAGTDEMTISEIGQGLGRSISEVFRITIVMERRGWLTKNPQNDRYRIAYRMLDVAYRGTRAQALASVAAPVMQTLADTTNQSCHLVIGVNGKGLVIHRQENAGPAGFAMRTGSAINIITSCSGHVLLAFDGTAPYETLIAAVGGMDPPAARDLALHLAVVRARGYEMQPSARTAGVTDISVPIFGLGGGIAAALTIPYLLMIDGSQTTDLDQTRQLLQSAGERISALLGAA